MMVPSMRVSVLSYSQIWMRDFCLDSGRRPGQHELATRAEALERLKALDWEAYR